MKNRLLLVSYFVTCAAVLLIFFNIGRRPDAQTVHAVHKPEREPRLSALPKKDAANGHGRFVEAAAENFKVRGGGEFSAVKRSLEQAVEKPVLKISPEALVIAAELEADEFPEAALAAAALPEPGRSQVLIAVLASWARFEPEKAADFATENFGEDKVREALSAVFQSWGAKDPQGALRWYEELGASNRYLPRVGVQHALPHLFFSWARSNPQAAGIAAQEMAEAGGSFYAWVGIAGLAGIDEHRPGVIEAALAIEDEESRLKALSSVVGEWAWKDPAAAAAWLDKEGFSDDTTSWAVAERWSRMDPAASATWTYNRSPPEAREKALSRALSEWSRSDIEAAAEWLDKVGPTEGSIPIIANGYSSVDLDKAVQWAKRASEENCDQVIIGALAEAKMRDPKVDLSAHFGAGTLPAEEMAKKVDAHYKMLQQMY